MAVKEEMRKTGRGHFAEEGEEKATLGKSKDGGLNKAYIIIKSIGMYSILSLLKNIYDILYLYIIYVYGGIIA